ncbi:28S ribosomal protein S33, mitochondrial-like [Gigantopelta aegis]|uniref:28S ribosomal protein S33, mitochondrial-like n=1 Tax=Gigantopelta aegis TaxID=1735272 RepID=UPI001B889AFF|nr:28S ribosomal protein S33, mitochondrial-like [Gigantopelta aegis]
MTSNYARRMGRLAARIFGEVARPTNPTSMKVVKIFSMQPYHLKPEITEYYPSYTKTHLLMRTVRDFGLFRDEHQDFKEEMKRQRVLRGKIKPKKGEGKRAMKKK